MDMRQLRYFVAVAEELNFRRAAERLNISQPPLSIQIKAMEQELDTVLFDRNRHAVSLTGAGRILLNHARNTLREMDLAQDLVRRAGKGEAGIIRMGFVGSVPMLELFSYLLVGFRKLFPHVRVDPHHLSTGKQIAAVIDGTIDIAIIRPSTGLHIGSTLTSRILWSDELKVFFPVGHPLAHGHDSLSFTDLEGEKFIVIAAGSSCGVRDITIATCGDAGFIPNVVQEVHDLRTALWLVAGGAGIAVLPECYDQAGVAGVLSRRLSGPSIESHICLLTRTDNKDELANRFADYALQFRGLGKQKLDFELEATAAE